MTGTITYKLLNFPSESPCVMNTHFRYISTGGGGDTGLSFHIMNQISANCQVRVGTERVLPIRCDPMNLLKDGDRCVCQHRPTH
jgi:hypothetical protein